jgi:regulator of sirC expression with transglutaminase-like and TPR domain
MLNNLRTIHLDQQDYPRALAIVERIALLRPDDPRELRMRDALRRVTSQ